AWPARADATEGTNAAAPAARPTRPADPQRPPLDPAPAHPLALAARVHERAHADPRAFRAGLTDPRHHHHRTDVCSTAPVTRVHKQALSRYQPRRQHRSGGSSTPDAPHNHRPTPLTA